MKTKYPEKEYPEFVGGGLSHDQWLAKKKEQAAKSKKKYATIADQAQPTERPKKSFVHNIDFDTWNEKKNEMSLKLKEKEQSHKLKIDNYFEERK